MATARIGLLTTCIIDLMRPQVAKAVVSLLDAAGYELAAPAAQTCCGQPALNAGRRDDAKQLIRRMADQFAEFESVLAPSGSCVGAIRTHIRQLFEPQEAGRAQVDEFAGKCQELSEFLLDRDIKPGRLQQTRRVAYHDSCAGLRELGIKAGPRSLLEAAGHELVELADADVCCGFGGTFAVKFGTVSGRMADDKCSCAVASGADVLALGDVGCLLNIEGRMARRGDAMPVRHYAELLVEQI